MSDAPLFSRVALIGFGLIGGSIARAARAQGLAGEIVTTARSPATRARVQELGVVDRVVETNIEAVKDADLVILCIPVGACGPVAEDIAPHLMPGRETVQGVPVMGYGYQWWIPGARSGGDFTGIGIYGQFIYVNPERRVVIAKTSAYADYNNTGDVMEYESVTAFQAIANGL